MQLIGKEQHSTNSHRKDSLVSKLNPSEFFNRVTVKKRMRLNLIKTQGYLSVQKDTWLFAKQGREKNIKIRIKLSLITLTLKKCKNCLSKEGCYQGGAKFKIYSLAIKSNDHLSRRNFRKHLILKKWPDIAIKSKRRMPN